MKKFILKKTIKPIDVDIHFRVLNLLEEEPNMTQRELADKLGISLGGVNYCIKALIDVGQIKIQNFNKHSKKIGYLYLLTPQGVTEKARLASGFLKRKMTEYYLLKEEIESLQSKIKI